MGSSYQVAFFDDRIEIENPGILLPGLTVEDMLQGVSKIRNRVIARVFRELDLIEQWGSGVRRIFKEAEALWLPEPEIVEVGMRVRFIVHLAESIAVQPESKEIRGILDITEHQVSELGASTGTMLELRRHQVEVLKKCKNECSIVDLMELTERTDRSKFRKRILSPLLDAGFIEMTIPDKPRSSKQKYRMTAKGEAFLAKEDQGGVE
ncbi:MAG: ATP-binding protein [Methanosarcinaceae archaeon]